MIPFFVGTYTSGSSQGIYSGLLDYRTGKIEKLRLAAKLDNPSFLTLHPTIPVLYACSEMRHDGKREGSKVVAMQIELDGSLTEINAQPSGGSGPCFISTDRTGKVALVANYASGSVASMAIKPNGSLSPIVSLIQHVGKSVVADRQAGPHAHCIQPDPSNRFACAVDLGLDQVLVYEMNVDQGTLTARPTGNLHTKPGSGPRHIAFHPNSKHAFIINELDNTLSMVRWDAATGTFSPLCSLSTLPADYAQESSTAEVLVHPQGAYVYASNRGHDSFAVFANNDRKEELKLIDHTPSGGKTPRNFRLDPTGQFLLAANQDSDSIVVFKIDFDTRRLTQVGTPISIGSPSCIKFIDPA